jgi:D-amino-acid dehydrogenase
MRVIVLGGGVIGVASAWYLAQDGCDVTVVERQDGVALETSFANGGQISVSHAEPWAQPGAPLQFLKYLGREDSPLLWRLRADPSQWAWGLRFLRQCTPARMRANIAAILQLALYSRACLQALRKDMLLEYDCLERGILHIYSDCRQWQHALAQAAVMRQYGCERVEKSARECLEIEPALRRAEVDIVGGTYTPGDESGDAHEFSRKLAAKCESRGVKFRFKAAVERIATDGDRVAGIRLTDGEVLSADAYVVALGSHTPLLLRPCGVRLPIFPAKGYSITVPLAADDVAPTVSLTDDGHKLVFSRLGARLRVAGTAEFAGYDATISETRCAAIERRTRALFPGLPQEHVAYWAGLRPATPGNVPVIGRAAFRNLYVNSGHGTLGWTMACGSGRLLADLVGGRAPEVDPALYRPAAAGAQPVSGLA